MGISAGVVGIMMTIICCKTLCEFLLELSAPERTTPVAATATVATTVATVASVKAAMPTIIEMPILIRIYLPQQQPQQQSQPSDAAHTKTSFDPLPV
jgi:hypothetical protein